MRNIALGEFLKILHIHFKGETKPKFHESSSNTGLTWTAVLEPVFRASSTESHMHTLIEKWIVVVGGSILCTAKQPDHTESMPIK